MQAIILAAGKGTRLGALTLNRSKAMLPIVGKPIVARVMGDLAAGGVNSFVLVVSPEDREIVRYFTDESPLDADVRFVYQPEPSGTADALRCVAPLVNDDFLLAACDNLFPAGHSGRMITHWQTSRPDALLTLMPVPPEAVCSTGVVALEGEWVRRIVEKPALEAAPSNIASLPLYIFTPRILDQLADLPLSPRGEYEVQDAIQRLIDRGGRVRGLSIEHRLTLIRPADLLALNRWYLTRGSDPLQLAPRTVEPNTRLIPPLHIESGTAIGDNCVVGPNVVIERDCRISDGANIREAVLLRAAVVPPGATIAEQVVAGNPIPATG
jgi:Nucleoside-diphosphate-sugar pyrophosphorylase involved in lipopolysaccharide biosynthesis/translation initiation factor 2B, gamma/epsilon subunits (eIF-2Bgamma/eIF-2Bepsilon)